MKSSVPQLAGLIVDPEEVSVVLAEADLTKLQADDEFHSSFRNIQNRLTGCTRWIRATVSATAVLKAAGHPTGTGGSHTRICEMPFADSITK